MGINLASLKININILALFEAQIFRQKNLLQKTSDKRPQQKVTDKTACNDGP